MGIERRHDVLIVDDNVDFAEFVMHIVQSIGLQASIINRSNQFESKVKELKPRLVVLDIEMPDQNGMSLAQWLGRYTSEHDLEIAVLILSGYGLDMIRLCRSVAEISGIADVRALSKPVDASTLSACLKEVLGQ